MCQRRTGRVCGCLRSFLVPQQLRRAGKNRENNKNHRLPPQRGSPHRRPGRFLNAWRDVLWAAARTRPREEVSSDIIMRYFPGNLMHTIEGFGLVRPCSLSPPASSEFFLCCRSQGQRTDPSTFWNGWRIFPASYWIGRENIPCFSVPQRIAEVCFRCVRKRINVYEISAAASSYQKPFAQSCELRRPCCFSLIQT